MHARQMLPEAVTRLARCQAGVVSRFQLLGMGVSEQVIRRLLDREWTTLLPGVYLTHRQAPSWHARAWAGFLFVGEESALAGQAALHLATITTQPPEVIEVCYPHASKYHPRPGWEFTRTRHMPPVVGELSRIRPEFAVLDLCQRDRNGIANVLTQAVSSGKVSEGKLRQALAQLTRVKHRGLIEDMLGFAGSGIHSPLELLYATDVEKAHGLPVGKRQVREGKYRRDVKYEWNLTVELDGRLGHTGMGTFRDWRRDNEHLVQGHPTLRYGWDDCTQHACEVAYQVAQVLCAQGWPGIPTRCDRCALIPGDW